MGSEQATDGAPSEYALLAARHGLQLQVGRPPLGRYLRDLWRSRNFIWALATTRTYARNENTYLGQVWSILNPLLYASVFYVVFGKILGTGRGIDNFTGFLIIGVFVFQFCSGALTTGANAVIGNTAMIRSLRFPRAVLPIAAVATEFLTLLPAIVVMFIIVSITGERPTWTWLLAVPMFFVIALFNAGISLVAARLVAQQRDFKNLIPVGVQLLRYMSGVFFSIQQRVPEGFAGDLMLYQPYALSLEVIRGCLLEEFPLNWAQVGVMCGWAVVMSVGGLIYFWRAEGRYGVE